MSFYEVIIDGEVYQGSYSSAADAVFGAMRKQENDKSDTPGKSFADYREGRCTKKEWQEAGDQYRQWLNKQKLISVKELSSRGGPRHKAKRVG